MPKNVFKMLSPILKRWEKEHYLNTEVPKTYLTLPTPPLPSVQFK